MSQFMVKTAEIIEVSILRFDTIQMDKDTNLYFVSLERRILRIVSVSFCISIRYISQQYNNFKIHTFSTLPLLLDFAHPVRRSDNPSVRGKKAKREKKTKKKRKNMPVI
jgi:hypothetical protein